MTGDRLQARSLVILRREAVIQLGLGVLSLVVAATGTCLLLLSRIHPSVWLGVAGALTLGMTFLSEGRQARDEYAWQCASGASATEMTPIVLRTPHQIALTTHRRRLLGCMVFGIVAMIGGPGLSVLLQIVSGGGVSTMDLLAWVLFTLPIALAVWMLPPRGLGTRSEPGPG